MPKYSLYIPLGSFISNTNHTRTCLFCFDSGVVALLELARLFGSLFKTFQTRGLVNMVFLLTTGSAFNYLGADKWASEVEGENMFWYVRHSFIGINVIVLSHSGRNMWTWSCSWLMTFFDAIRCWKQANDEVIQALDFVLCLDSIGHGQELYFHASKPQEVKYNE